MYDILVDANVIVGLYREDVLGLSLEKICLTGSAVTLFQKINDQRDIIYLDDGGENDGQIINEWKRNIPRAGKEWFVNWYTDLLISGRIRFIIANSRMSCNLLRHLCGNGFPRNGGDKWYVRTAMSVVLLNNCYVTIISEDIDFFDPINKKRLNGQERIRSLQMPEGIFPTLLANANIRLSCISNY